MGRKRETIIIYSVLGGILLAGVLIWSCMYFIIYAPLLERTWKPANCSISEIRGISISSLSTTYFSVYTAVVEVNNTVLGLGYGCASSDYEAIIGDDLGLGWYPYEYAGCSGVTWMTNECYDWELLQPPWFCFDYDDKDEYQVGNRTPCKYYLNGSGPDFSYPQVDADFIEVIYQDEVYIPWADYYALWVCVFGGMICLPCLLCILCLSVPFGWCTASERQKYKDCYDRYLKCRCKQKPRCLQEFGDLFEKIGPNPLIIWLFTVKKAKDLAVLKHALVREVADFIS